MRLADDLKREGATVWLDQVDIVPGEKWDHAVQQALKDCRRMIVILSPASVDSSNVLDEVSFALSKQKTVIPVLYQDCEIPFRLGRFHYVDFVHDYSRGLRELIRTLNVKVLDEINVALAKSSREDTIGDGTSAGPQKASASTVGTVTTQEATFSSRPTDIGVASSSNESYTITMFLSEVPTRLKIVSVAVGFLLIAIFILIFQHI